MVTFPKYESYKDSGVEWLGEIPSHWDVGRLKHAIESAVNGVWGEDPDDNDDDIVCIRVADFIRHNYRVSLDRLTKRKISNSDFQSRQLRSGDLLLEKSGGGDMQLVGQIVLYDHKIPAVCSNFLARLRIRDAFSNRFLAYVNACLYALKINYKHIKQTTGIQNIDADSYFLEFFAYPNKKEQENIADFLDRKTAEIDQAIAQKQRLIELLQEQKAILINQAVTKGLDPNVPMCDRGIEWLGNIPKHWDARKGKFLFKQSRLPVRNIDDVVTAYRDGEVTLRTNRRVDGYTVAILEQGYQGVRIGQLVINSMDAFAGAIGISDSEGKCSPEYVVCDPVNFEIVEPAYYALLLREMALKGYIEVICPAVRQRGLRIRYNSFAQLLLPLPPKKEQQSIVQEVSKTLSKSNEVILRWQKEINLLKEFKNIVISLAVTGEIKV